MNVKLSGAISILVIGFISIIFTAIFLTGCATTSKSFNDSIQGPQLIVEPLTISLGVATLMGTDIIFKGKGFDPGDKVCIKISGSEDSNREVEIGASSGDVDENGLVTSHISKEIKIFSILRAMPTPSPKGYVVKIENAPIPKGAYTVSAVGLKSGKEAQSSLTFSDPSFIDRLKDWIGNKMGKIIR